jgi:hypothetical protein
MQARRNSREAEIPSEVIDLIGGGGWTRTNDLRIMRTQEGSEPFGKFSTLLLFSTGYKSAVGRCDPFCLEMIRFDRATISISLQ